MQHNLEGQTFLVLGLGKSGLGAIQLLHEHGAKVLATDDQQSASPLPSAEFLAPEMAAEAKFDCLVISPGVPLTHAVARHAQQRGIPVMGELELAYQFLRGPVAAITGSNGKTTTTALCGAMLERAGVRAQVGGNIGNAVSGMVATSAHLQWNLLEVSSFQLETVDLFHPRIAAVLNITPNHLDRHGSFESYRNAKARILANQVPGDEAILNDEDQTSQSLANRARARVRFFNGEAACLREGRLELLGRPLMSASDVLLPGRHNLDNVLAAALIAALAGASQEAIAQAAAEFRGVAHRLEFVREWRGIKFFNDSKATSVDAARKALTALPGPLWVILGGKGKGAPYAPLAPLLKDKAKAALFIGEDTPNLERELATEIATKSCGTLAEALTFAVRSASPGDTVLLAPACASYDQFTSYEQRGDTFRRLVEEL
ncbi:MAG: UDP-N-acetylmuramoyl-L-alanine--D-glutamate ligase [Bryobacter sp.]|nr:UDP-N-acetylmuramoyl-L-alanine--D-glutamate ligase [Bryobacter sp.]